MQNKKVIRKVPKAGEFTTIQHAILYDKRLTSTAFRILTSILSDKDEYKLTQGLIIKRFDIHKDTVKSAFENLEECGYMRRKEQKRGHYYIISEYGNLNKETEQEGVIEVLDTELNTTGKNEVDNLAKMGKYLNLLGDFYEYGNLSNDINDIIFKYLVEENLTHYHEPKNEIEKLVSKMQRDIYKECMLVTSKIDEHTPKKAITEYSNWLKDKLFVKHSLDFNHKTMWLKIKVKHRSFKTDHETAMRDAAEQRHYDGDSD